MAHLLDIQTLLQVFAEMEASATPEEREAFLANVPELAENAILRDAARSEAAPLTIAMLTKPHMAARVQMVLDQIGHTHLYTRPTHSTTVGVYYICTLCEGTGMQPHTVLHDEECPTVLAHEILASLA